MILLIPLLVLFGVCAGCWYRAYTQHNDMPFSMLFTMIIGLFLLIALGAVLFHPYSVRGEIAEYHAVENSIANARATDITDIERAALTQKIIEANKWLAKVRYDNNTLWDIYIPDEVNDLEPLR